RRRHAPAQVEPFAQLLLYFTTKPAVNAEPIHPRTSALACLLELATTPAEAAAEAAGTRWRRGRRRGSRTRHCFFRKPPGVGDGVEGEEEFRDNSGAVDEEGLVEVHLETDGPAGDQGHTNRVPVLVGGVLDGSPALQVGLVLPLGWQHQPVTRLPDRV